MENPPSEEVEDSTLLATEYVKQQHGMSISSSRTWIMCYSILTWLMTIAFFGVVINSYGGSVNTDPSSFLQKRGILTSVGCLTRKSFSQWNLVFKRYENFYANKTQTPEWFLHHALLDMHCPIQDGDFAFTSMQCVCVRNLHINVFQPHVNGILSGPGNDGEKESALKEYGKTFSEKQIMPQCFFAYRPAQWIVPEKACATQVVPYAHVMFINTIAGCFAGLYFVVYWGQAQQSSKKEIEEKIGRLKFYRWGALGIFVLLNLILGIWSMAVSFFSQEDANAGLFVGFMVVYFVTLALFTWQMNNVLKSMFPGASPMKGPFILITAFNEQNVQVTMRMLFWVQYIITAPIMLMLYDAMHQSREPINTAGRLLMVIGLGFTAFGFDVCLAMHEALQMQIFTAQEDRQQQQNKKGVPTPCEHDLLLTIHTGDNARSSTWWAWFLWITIAASLFVMDKPIHMNPDLLETLVPGSNSIISLGVILYIVGMPILSRVPGMSVDNAVGMCWMEDRHAISLALCLAVTFVSTALVTLTLAYWQVFS